MKAVNVYVFAAILLLASCGQAENNPKDQSGAKSAAAKTETSVPGIEKLNFTDTIRLKADENMRFDKELFRVRAGGKLRLILINTGAKSKTSMTHNAVILARGTDIADFADAVHNAKDEQYVPSSVSSLVIAHTKMVGGGESDEVDFSIPQAGVYDFICSFPGHWGTMQGKIVAE
jgi:azurin